MDRRHLLAGAAAVAASGQANAFGIGRLGLGMGRGGAVSRPNAPQIAIPTTNLKAVYSSIRVAGWAGMCRRVQRSSDTTQLDIGFVGNVVDKASEDAFAAGSILTVVKEYDQSGNGNDRVQTTNANRPLSSPLCEWNGIRPLTFDGWPTAANPKFMDTPVMAGIDRQAVSVYMMVSPRAPNQQTQYVEGFSDTGFVTSAAYFICAGGSQGANFNGSFFTGNVYPRAHMQTLSVIGSPSNVRFRFDGTDNALGGAVSSTALQVFRFGKLSVNANYHSSYDMFFTAIYAQADAAPANLVIENALNASFNPDRTARNSWTKQLIVDGSSLETGYFATALQNASWQGGFGRGAQGNVREWEYFKMAIGGTTLAQANSAKGHVTGIINLARSKIVIGAPSCSNDISVATYTSVADAQTGNVNSAQNIYTNQLLPYVVAMLAAGVTRVIVDTIIPRGGFDGTTNWKETARVYYNNLVIAGAGANNYTVADLGAMSQFQTFDPTYYASDNIHCTPAGYAVREAFYKPLVLAA